MSLYDQDQDLEDEDSGLTRMVNVSDEAVTIRVSSGPGQRPRKTVIQPWPDGSAVFDRGYCEPVRGAGAKLLLPIISRKTVRWGIPFVVPEQHAEKARQRYLTVSASKAGRISGADGPEAALKAAMAKIALLEAQARIAAANPVAVQPDALEAAMTPNVAPKASKPKKAKKAANGKPSAGAPQG